MPKPFHDADPRRVPRFTTNPVFVDVDGNGKFDPPGDKACAYPRRALMVAVTGVRWSGVVRQAKPDMPELMRIDRAKIQAEVLGPVVGAMSSVVGREEALDIVRDALWPIRSGAFDCGAATGRKAPTIGTCLAGEASMPRPDEATRDFRFTGRDTA